MSIHLLCWHLLWVDDGITSVPLGERKGIVRTQSHPARNLWETQKLENGFEFFALTTVVILLTQGLRASAGLESLCLHSMERRNYRQEKYLWNLLCFKHRMWLLR